MHANEVELVLSKSNVYPISGNELFELLKGLGECKGMFKEEKTCFFGNFFVGLFPFEKNSQGAIDYSTGCVYFDGCDKLWINSVKVFKHHIGKFEQLNIHIIRLIAAQDDEFFTNKAFYDEVKERKDKITFSLIIQNKNTSVDLLNKLLYLVDGEDLFKLIVDVLIEQAIEHSEELKLIKDIDGLNGKILARLVGK